MTGKRVGNPKVKRPFGVCRSCGEPRHFKARRLCETCWIYAKRMGTLTQFPSVLNAKNERDMPGRYCRCFAPVPDAMPVWNTRQCLKCGREIAPS